VSTATPTTPPIPAELQAHLDAAPRQMWHRGGWADAADGATYPVVDPATGAEVARVPDARAADAVAALDAVVEAGPALVAMAPRARGEVLRRAYELMVERTDALAAVMTIEMGKALAESRAEIAYAAEFFRWFSEEAVRVGGEWRRDPAGGYDLLTTRRPVGPVVILTPWNFPLAMATRKIGPAIAAGCPMVWKPAEDTPLSALLLAGILGEAGLPDGALEVLTGPRSEELVAPLLSDPRTRKLTFTGSTRVGRLLAAQAAERLLHCTFELGGNAPFLVFDDADVDAALEGAMVAKMRNIGESCVAANRFLLHDSVFDSFAEQLGTRMRALSVGPGYTDAAVGPLINLRQRDRVAALVRDALDRGATALCGGDPADVPPGEGFFYPPTVLVGVPADARLLHEEIFGPVAPLVRFADEAEALRLANGVDEGLVAYAYTRDIGRARRVAGALESGMVGLNRGLVSNPAAPFGGVKQSGYGREGGREGIEAYLDVTYVALGS